MKNDLHDEFTAALYGQPASCIPPEYDWFAPLLGDWEFDYYDGYENENYDAPARHVKGEWIFRRILNGAGIEDMFICPSRETRAAFPQPDGEYGVAVRMWNREKLCYDMVYACEGYMGRLCFIKENGVLVGTVLDDTAQKWRFCEITEDAFHWQNVTVMDDGHIRVNCNAFGRRK